MAVAATGSSEWHVATSINDEGGGDAFLDRNFCTVGTGAPSPLPLILMEYAAF